MVKIAIVGADETNKAWTHDRIEKVKVKEMNSYAKT